MRSTQIAEVRESGPSGARASWGPFPQIAEVRQSKRNMYAHFFLLKWAAVRVSELSLESLSSHLSVSERCLKLSFVAERLSVPVEDKRKT